MFIASRFQNRMRQSVRQPPKEWTERKKSGLCPVCGAPKEKFEKRRRVYCSKKCSDEWGEWVVSWTYYRWLFIKKHGKFCDMCGITEVEAEAIGMERCWDTYFEVDHILPLVLGGSMWDEKNHQVLCYECHKKKTADDMKELARHRRGYDKIRRLSVF